MVSSTKARIVKNIGAMTGSQLISWLLALVIAVILPRYLGPAFVGKIYLANSIWAIVAIFITFGSGVLLTKEIARDPDRLSELFGSVIGTRAMLYIIGLAAVLVYVWLVGYPVETIYIILIVGISHILGQFLTAAQAALEGLERMEVTSLGSIIGKFVDTVLIILVVLLGQSIYFIVAVASVSTAAQLIVLIRALRRTRWFKINFNLSQAKWALSTSFPYLLSLAVFAIYQQCDIVVISFVADETTIGWYGSAVRLTGTFLCIPTILMTAVFPVSTRLHSSDSESLIKLFRKSFDLLFIISVPIGLGVMVIANQLVVLLFGSGFAGSGPVLGIMGIVIIMLYQNILIGRFLISIDRQNTWTAIMAIAVAVTVILDLILIPWSRDLLYNGAIGGALSYLITELGMTVVGIALLPRGYFDRSTAFLILRTLVAGVAMVGVTWLFRDTFIIAPIVAGAVTYISLIIVIRLVPYEDIAVVLEIARSILRPVRPDKPQVTEVS